MRFPRHARTFRGQFDAAPFACVFFVFVLFLVLSSSLVHVPGIQLELPHASEVPGVNGPVLMVTVDRGGRMYYDSQVIEEKNLKTQLRADVLKFRQTPTLIVQADRTVSYDVIIRLGVLAREAGMKGTLLATREGVFAAASESTNAPAATTKQK